MATVGQPLTTPETGWKRYSNIQDQLSFYPKYTGVVVSYGDSGLFGQVGSSLELTFKGTKIRIMTYMGLDRANDPKIIIDGVEEPMHTMGGANAQNVLIYEKVGLPNTTHSVKLIAGTYASYYEGYLVIQSIDIDSTGRLLHPNEVTDPKDLVVGKRIRCHYQATANAVGAFSGLGQETSGSIPIASSTTPNGDFYFIMVEDWNGQKRLIADRNIQHSISWDTLNTAGIAGAGIPANIFNKAEELYVGKEWADVQGKGSLTKSISNGVISVTDAPTTWSGNLVTTGTPLRLDQMLDTLDEYVLASKIDIINNNVATIALASIGLMDGAGNTLAGIGFSDQWGTDRRTLGVANIGSVASSTFYDAQMTSLNAEVAIRVKGLSVWFLYNGKVVHEGVLTQKPKYACIQGGRYSSSYPAFTELKFTPSILKPLRQEHSMRLLTGGVSAADKYNEWDKYVVNSTLDGTITAGDVKVWNWNAQARSWTSTASPTATSRVCRGYTAVDLRTESYVSSAAALNQGFRPVLELTAKMGMLFSGGLSSSKTELEDVTLSGEISHRENLDVRYAVLVNGVQVYPSSGFSVYTQTPFSISQVIYGAILNMGVNNVTVVMEDTASESIEQVFALTKTAANRYLIKVGSEYKMFSRESATWATVGVVPNETLFITAGMRDIGALFSLVDRVDVPSDAGSVLGSGKVFKATVGNAVNTVVSIAVK